MAKTSKLPEEVLMDRATLLEQCITELVFLLEKLSDKHDNLQAKYEKLEQDFSSHLFYHPGEAHHEYD